MSENQGSCRIIVQYFGSFRVLLGQEQQELHWRTKKEKELFAHMSVLDGRAVSRSYLLDMLWPEGIPVTGVAMLHNMFHHIRIALRSYGGQEVLVYDRQRYMMDIGQITSTLPQIRELCRAIQKKDLAYIQDHAELFPLFLEEYLGEIDGNWVMPEREYYEWCFQEGVRMLAECWMNQQEYGKAIELLWRAWQKNPYSESVAYELIYCYGCCGELGKVKMVFEETSRILYSDLQVRPGVKLSGLYQSFINTL